VSGRWKQKQEREVEAEAGMEMEVEVGKEVEAVPLTITAPLDKHRLDAEESEIGPFL